MTKARFTSWRQPETISEALALHLLTRMAILRLGYSSLPVALYSSPRIEPERPSVETIS